MMNGKLQDLKYALQLLALPVSYQMSLEVGETCRVRALYRPYSRVKRELNTALSGDLTRVQKATLSRLDDSLQGLQDFPDCSDTTLRRHHGWQKIRRQARVALLTFGWELNLPPVGIIPDRRSKD